MAVDSVAYFAKDDHAAAAAGLRELERLVFQLSHAQSPPPDCREFASEMAAEFKKVIAALNRTGHARFRRGPAPLAFEESSQPTPPLPSSRPATVPQSVTLDFTKPKESFAASATLSASSSSFLSSLTGDGSVTGKLASSVLAQAGGAAAGEAVVVSAGKQQFAASSKRKASDRVHPADRTKPAASAGLCHCTKKRYAALRRSACWHDCIICG